MDKNRFEKDNISQRSNAGKPLHTYTPRSHEDLLRSHLQLDSARLGRLQNDLNKLANENDKLRRDLGKAYQDLEEKDNIINQLKNKPNLSPPSVRSNEPLPTTYYEVDGKPVALEELINHFNVILQRHHDLLNRKNNQIQGLQNELNFKRIVPDKREVGTQRSRTSVVQKDLMNDLTHQITLIRKEYEQVEYVLTDRNDKLERLIEELQRKLDQYSSEIQRLRYQLETQDKAPSATERLLHQKDKENEHLKNVITRFQTQMLHNVNNVPAPLEQSPHVPVRPPPQDISQKDPVPEPKYDDDLVNIKPVSSQVSFRNVSKPIRQPDENYSSFEQNPVSSQVLYNNYPERTRSPDAYEPHPVSSQLSYKYFAEPARLNDAQYPRFEQHSPGFCEACSNAYFPSVTTRVDPQPTSSPSPRKLVSEFYAQPPPRNKSKPRKSKGGCCGKKASETSNYPYEKHPKQDDPKILKEDVPKKDKEPKTGCCGKEKSHKVHDEKVINVHSPFVIIQNDHPAKLYPSLPSKDIPYENVRSLNR